MVDVLNHWTLATVRTVWVVDDEKKAIDVMSIDCNAVGTKVADGVGGELRTRNNFILDHHELKMVVQQQKLEAIKVLLQVQDNLDGLATPLGSAVGLVITFGDGSKNTVTLQDLTVDDWSWSMAGRTDRNKVTIPMRCNSFKIL